MYNMEAEEERKMLHNSLLVSKNTEFENIIKKTETKFTVMVVIGTFKERYLGNSTAADIF